VVDEISNFKDLAEFEVGRGVEGYAALRGENWYPAHRVSFFCSNPKAQQQSAPRLQADKQIHLLRLL